MDQLKCRHCGSETMLEFGHEGDGDPKRIVICGMCKQDLRRPEMFDLELPELPEKFV